MTHDGLTSGRAIVIGASGQDGYFLTERLINQNWRVHATRAPAVIVNPQLLRMSEPLIIQVDPSRARTELGWAPRHGLEVFLNDMFANLPRPVAANSAVEIKSQEILDGVLA